MPRAVVIGAGPAGLTAAIALRRIGVDVEIYERGPAAGEIGSGLTLWPNAMKALETIGAAEAVRAAGTPCDGIALYSWRGDVLNRTPRDLMERRFGGAGVALQRAELIQALRSLLEPGGPTYGTACVGFRSDAEAVTATFEDGHAARADLLVGADGIRSLVRSTLFAGAGLRYAGYPVYRAVATFPLGSDARVGSLLLGRGAQFGLFPMSRGRVYWFASVDAPPGSARGGASKDALLERFGDWKEPVRAVLEATPEPHIVVSDVYDTKPLRRWSRGRVTLVGDAAHPSTPNLGQGACQAIEDAVVLARCLGDGFGLDDALREYERRRHRRANAMAREARRMGRVGQLKNPLGCWVRDRMIAQTPKRLQLRHLDWMFAFEQ
jgi:2-polyprenyl-6-methoxyphenol hydroxylase-like FAD-dependent oxidoreductase